MQGYDWNDLKYLLALYRTGKLKEAGRTLGTSDTTVSRRIKAFEQHTGHPLFLRSAAGRYEPTDAAMRILPHAEAIEMENVTINERLGQITDRVTGHVRISSVPIIVNRILIPNLHSLIEQHPRLTVDLLPASENLDLSKREADLALRFGRPLQGGLRTTAQKLGALAFGVYAPKTIAPGQSHDLGWITYDDAYANLPQAQWLDATASRTTEARARLRVADAETALEAVAQGLGQSLLPRVIADADQRLLPLEWKDTPPTREVWLLSHVDQAARSSIATVKSWLHDLGWDTHKKL
ncbi:LysR family transcriptional regulator [Yoonia maricola]|uniref:LysR family transcriptional regulator n=1 Tax=Yoonia maricola TaxID=420999 RepID=A0A2M8WQE0_9RHOB|nr:LysR family transcriptional regulator [Yoonia maricola]PJI93066.1 LysR family transcriptional regulator [Yoonia maricola]